jgi:tetratricopeptide (TPR) repeat protein
MAVVTRTSFCLQPPMAPPGGGLPAPPPGQAEAERLADEVLAAPPDQVPFDVRAQALAVKGRFTAAVRLYAEGLRPYLPREYARGLLLIIDSHPCLKRPDSLRVPNPLEAEKHFAAGLNFYFEANYADAEKEFLLTVENDNQDARFFYFLGLSRLMQGKRDAYEDFDQGAILEQLSRPPSGVVSQALERIQGEARRVLNEARNRPRVPEGR